MKQHGTTLIFLLFLSSFAAVFLFIAVCCLRGIGGPARSGPALFPSPHPRYAAAAAQHLPYQL